MTSTRIPAILALLAVGLLAACASGGVSLQDTQWVLLSLNGQPPLADTTLTAEFSDDQVHGSSGCNQYFGAAEVTGSELTIRDVGSTMMYCMEPAGAMEQEQAFLDALMSVAGYRATADRLEMFDATGAVVLVFGAR